MKSQSCLSSRVRQVLPGMVAFFVGGETQLLSLSTILTERGLCTNRRPGLKIVFANF